MAEAILKIDAKTRNTIGKGASRRLRRLQEVIPAILYGGNEAPTNIEIDHKKLMHALEHEAFYSNILTLNLDNQAQRVVLKDLQRHPYKPAVLHADFQRVRGSDVINMHVPIHFINESKCPGIKLGGIINHLEVDLHIKCKADDLPEFIEVDMANLELDQAIHSADIKLPVGVEIINADNNFPIVNVHLSRQAKTEDNVDESANAEGNSGDNAKS